MTAPDAAPRQPPLALFALVWLAACLIITASAADIIAAVEFHDPDDPLRLVQVRDWVAGQSWYDVVQHRMNLPVGGDSHWSRLVDVPIAAIILLLRPLLGPAGAEMGALILAPLLTFTVVLALSARLGIVMLDRRHALLGCLMLPMLAIVYVQLRPMRIDHHGWQMALALGTTLALLMPSRLRSGLLAGGLLAIWLNVSLEGLPFAAAALALLALRWALDPAEARRLAAAVAALAGGSLLLVALTRNPALWSVGHCDQVSPPQLALLAVGAVGTLLATRVRLPALSPFAAAALRLGVLAIVGVAGIAAMLWVEPACAQGPFARLDPLIREIWYVKIPEGLPLWHQGAIVTGHILGVPLIGLAGAWLQWRRSEGEARTRWFCLFFLLAAATATAIMVQRAGAVANLLGIPGTIWLFRSGIDHALTLPSPLKKAGVAFASLLLLLPGQLVAAGAMLVEEETIDEAGTTANARCMSREQLSALNQLPPALIAAPLDIGPALLEASHHRVIASGHHRNAAAMLDVMHVFVLPPEQARAVLQRRGAEYLAICPSLDELSRYSRRGPDGLWAQLVAGRAPAWLEPMSVPGAPALRLWRVRREAEPIAATR